MKSVRAFIGLGFLLSTLLITGSNGQSVNKINRVQQQLQVGAQVYDGIIISFELEQVPVADSNPIIPAYKLHVEAYTMGFMDHSLLSSKKLGSCEPLRLKEKGSGLIKVPIGIIQSCTIFTTPSSPVYQFVSLEW
jgi:hypothetical protein